MTGDKIKVHIILDPSDEAVVEVVKGFAEVEVVQWDYSFDTAFQWTMQNEAQKIDVILASEYAQISQTDNEGKTIPRDVALLRRVKDLRMMRPQAKFLLLCDEDRDLPENRHFLSNLVGYGIYDFRTENTLTEESLYKMITGPKRDIAQVQKYLPENIESPSRPFVKDTKEEEKEEIRAIDIMARLAKLRGDQSKEQKVEKRAKVKHIIEKVRPAVVSFLSFSEDNGGASLLAQQYAQMLAKKAKVALVEVPSTGIPRLGFSTGMRSRRRTVETAIQRIEDNEDIMNVLLAPEEAVKLTPSYDSAITKKIKALPKDFYLLGGRDDMLPHVPVFNHVKGTTLEKAPGEIVNQLIFRHGFDCVVFVLAVRLNVGINFNALKVSNYIYCMTDQHPAHLSWLKQNINLLVNQLGIPARNLRLLLFPYYDLNTIRLTDLETAIGHEFDYKIPDIRQELLDMAWYKGEISNPDASRTIAEMIFDATGYSLDELNAKEKKTGFWGRFKKKKNKQTKQQQESTQEEVKLSGSSGN